MSNQYVRNKRELLKEACLQYLGGDCEAFIGAVVSCTALRIIPGCRSVRSSATNGAPVRQSIHSAPGALQSACILNDRARALAKKWIAVSCSTRRFSHSHPVPSWYISHARIPAGDSIHCPTYQIQKKISAFCFRRATFILHRSNPVLPACAGSC